MNNITGPGNGPSSLPPSATTTDSNAPLSPKRDFATMDGEPPSLDEQPPPKKQRLRRPSNSFRALRGVDLRLQLNKYSQMLSAYRSTRTALAVVRRELKRSQEEHSRLRDEQRQRLSGIKVREADPNQQFSSGAALKVTTMADNSDEEAAQYQRTLSDAVNHTQQEKAEPEREIDQLKHESHKVSEQTSSLLQQELSQAKLRVQEEAKKFSVKIARLKQDFAENRKQDAADYRQAIENANDRFEETLKELRGELVAVKQENANLREHQARAYERAHADATRQYCTEVATIEEQLETLRTVNEALTNRANHLLNIVKDADARRHRELQERGQRYFRDATERARRHAQETQFLRDGIEFSRRRADLLRQNTQALGALLAETRGRANELEQRLNVTAAEKRAVEQQLQNRQEHCDIAEEDNRQIRRRIEQREGDYRNLDRQYGELYTRFHRQHQYIASARSGIRRLYDLAIEDHQRQDRRDRGLPPLYGEHNAAENQVPWARNVPATGDAGMTLATVEEIARRHFIGLLAHAPTEIRARVANVPERGPALFEQTMRGLASVSARLAEFAEQGHLMEVPARENSDAVVHRRDENRQRAKVYQAFARLLLDCIWLFIARFTLRAPVNNMLDHGRIITQISIHHREADLTLSKLLSEAIVAHERAFDDENDSTVPKILAFLIPLRLAARELTARAFPAVNLDGYDVEDDGDDDLVPDGVEMVEEDQDENPTPPVPLVVEGRPPIRFFRESLRVLRYAHFAKMEELNAVAVFRPRPEAIPGEDEDGDDDDDEANGDDSDDDDDEANGDDSDDDSEDGNMSIDVDLNQDVLYL